MAMRLDQSLKLYIGLYFLAFLMTWFISVPMLMHVSRNQECLLFVTPRVLYGPSATCFLVGLLPMFVALAVVVLIVLNVLQLRSLKAYLRNSGPHSSKDYHNRPTHIFWRMVVFHGVVTAIMCVVTAIVTIGYATTCQNLQQEVKLRVRARIQVDQFGGGYTNNEAYDRYFDSRSINRYLNPNTDYLGRNTFERGITCRTILTDVEITRQLKANHEKNPLYRRYTGFHDPNQVADVGNIRYYTYRDNVILELAMAGSWICVVILIAILIMMVLLRHHIRGHLTDESMWGGSEIGRRSVSRISNQSFDRGSRHSNQSGSRYSAGRGRGGSRAPSEHMSLQGGGGGGYPAGGRGGRPYRHQHQQQMNNHSMVEKPGNDMLSYFAENPPVDEEVDVDAALYDRSLDDMIPQEPTIANHHVVDSPKEPDTSFGSDVLPVVLDQTQDPIPLGDEVSEGMTDVPIVTSDQPYCPPYQASNRVTGRRGARNGGGVGVGQGRTPPGTTTTTFTQQFHHTSRLEYEDQPTSPVTPNSSYMTQLGHQSLI